MHKVSLQDLIKKARGLLGRTRAGKRDVDVDVEQASLRVIVSLIALAYVWFLILTGDGFSVGMLMGLAAGAGDAVIGIWMIWTLRSKKWSVVPLRYLGTISDNVALTIGMAGAGEGGVAVIGVYLWITIGNGFRFGPRYLLLSYWLSLAGFALQLVLVPFWAQHVVIGIGLLLALTIVPLYVLVLLIRLTGQKDAAEQLSTAKSRFVANVSHELRTPLTGIFAVYDLLRSRKMTPDDREIVGMLGVAVRTLKTSVDAVLQMSKLEAGAETVQRTLFNLWFFLQQLAAHVRPQSVAKHLTWHLQIDPAVPCNVAGDPGHLAHILGNLLNNAFKFTAAGGVSLRVSPSAEGHVRFEIADTGIGIPSEQQERLFERFVQVDSSATRRHGGTGLGTSIARDLTELMGGKIGVISAPNQGSTFWLDLPLSTGATQSEANDWGAWRQVLLVGPPGTSREHAMNLVRSLGLDVVVDDGALHTVPGFSAERYLAALLIMPAADAAAYAETMLLDSAGRTCPWIVLAPAYTRTQLAAFVRAGAAALLPAEPAQEVLRSHLTALLQRFELPSQPEERTLPSNGVVRPLTILLADDNLGNQMLLCRILENAGHSVQTAERGDRAFDHMAAGGLDLALLDLNMPDISGPDVIKLFRASSIGGNKLPIIILSADATPVAKQESLEAGADEFVTKPIAADTLLATIERVMLGSAARHESSTNSPGPQESPSDVSTVLVNQDRVHDLERIARGDSKFLDTYISASFEDIERAISDLSTAVATHKIRSQHDALHIIEGTGASIGASALVANCTAMRRAMAASKYHNLGAQLAEVSTTYALTKSTILAMLHESRRSLTRSHEAPR